MKSEQMSRGTKTAAHNIGLELGCTPTGTSHCRDHMNVLFVYDAQSSVTFTSKHRQRQAKQV